MKMHLPFKGIDRKVFGIRGAFQRSWRRDFVRRNVIHLHGPRRFHLAENEIVGILLGRDVLFYLPALLDHYRNLGVDRFVFFDNGSSDGSADYVADQPHTIVVSCGLNFRDFQAEMRYCAASDFAVGGWRLAFDADELLDYPNSSVVSLPDLTQRLSGRGQTALVAQMLEMVPNGSLQEVSDLDFPSSINKFRWYSTNCVTAYDYHDHGAPIRYFATFNTVASPDVKILTGGIRRSLFSENCLLTKHVLFRSGSDILPLPHPHISCGLHCADFTAVLRHYKFAGRYLEREMRRKAENRLSHAEGDLRLKIFESDDDIVFLSSTAKQDPTPEELVEQGFLTASGQAMRMLQLL